MSAPIPYTKIFKSMKKRGVFEKLFKWKGWRWLGRAAASYVGIQAAETGVSAVKDLDLRANLSVYIPGQIQVEILCEPTRVGQLLRTLADTVGE